MDAFTYQVCDATELCATATVTIAVAAAPNTDTTQAVTATPPATPPDLGWPLVALVSLIGLLGALAVLRRRNA